MARLRYPRQREYPQPPPPSKNNTRITISMVVIVHLFFAIQCNADWEPKLNVRTTRSKPEPRASVMCRFCLPQGKKCCSARHLLAEVGMREMRLRTRTGRLPAGTQFRRLAWSSGDLCLHRYAHSRRRRCVRSGSFLVFAMSTFRRVSHWTALFWVIGEKH